MNRRNALKKMGLLAGAGLLTPSVMTLLQSCQSESRSDWEPDFFNEEEARFISAFLETLLPTTATPGALDVKSDIFIDKVFATLYSEEAQAEVRRNIDQFNTDCKTEHGALFADLDSPQRATVLSAAEAASPKFNGRVWGVSVGEQEPVGFYRSLKSTALWAYLYSEEIGVKVLSYDPVPGEYLGCIPLSEVGNSWSL